MTLQLRTPSEPEPESPAWWLERLNAQLEGRQEHMRMLDDYYHGRQPLAFASDKFRDTFGRLFGAFADNFCALVVDATEERLNVEGFRFGAEEGDDSAWKIWQANGLDSLSQLAHIEALIKGVSYAMVDPVRPMPEVTIEDPLQTIVAYDPRRRSRRKAAMKRWQDDAGFLHANVYLTDRVVKYISRDKPRVQSAFGRDYIEIPKGREWWVETQTIVNVLREIPVIPLINRPRLVGEGESEIHAILPLQDFVNKILMDAVIASEFASFRQRWATGIDIPTDENGNPVEPFQAAVDRLWVTSSTDARFGDFEQTSLEGHIKLIETTIQHIASITRTPPHYLLGQSGSFPSGESLKATETGLTAKVVRKQRYFGEAWEEVIRLCFRAQGNDFANFPAAETIWRDAEYRAPGQWADALLKLGQIGVPQRALWEEWGASPQKIARWSAMRAEELLLAPVDIPQVNLPAAPEEE